jgi:hypothetical protein
MTDKGGKHQNDDTKYKHDSQSAQMIDTISNTVTNDIQ